MSKNPVESTPAGNTRGCTGDRHARVESSSSVESEHLDATVVRHVESDSASFVRLCHLDSEPHRDANLFPTANATLVPQPSNPAPLDSVLSALLFQMKQLSSKLASQDTAQSAAITAVSDRLSRLERLRSDRSDRESANLQSVPLPHQPATVVVESRESRRDRAITPPKMRSSIR